MKPCSHIYLSSHLDDAVLSCGGRIWQQVQSGERVLVVTVFAGNPPVDAPLSPLAQELHAQWGLPLDAPARRREEDSAALASLGAEAMHWSYLDCIYRQISNGRYPYDSEEALWGEVHSAEETLVAELAGRLAKLPLKRGGTVYAPLAVGHHVDHQIVRRAVASCGRTPIYYEDYPYAEDAQAVRDALAGGSWRVALMLLFEEALGAKTAAIACYRSQISAFWADAAEMTAAVRAFAERTGGDGPAERYWRVIRS
jgi:LmbE family N-acetylglucosaminyl deacetylase